MKERDASGGASLLLSFTRHLRFLVHIVPLAKRARGRSQRDESGA